jgi:hypothetical protein
MNERDRVTDAAATTSTIHRAHATVIAQDPQRGTQMKIHISMSVANPMGIVAKKSELVGSWIITGHISGYKAYRRIEVIIASENITTLSMKKTIAR